MDVYIPEEYVKIRRREKAAVADARRWSEMVSDSSKVNQENRKFQSSSVFMSQKEVLVSEIARDEVPLIPKRLGLLPKQVLILFWPLAKHHHQPMKLVIHFSEHLPEPN
ncbi:hypothetical protein IFM89_006672 [Coptis chinensis]|uniref:Uncharacterized protein n=1 Tax=Coptis chinensis TaxID=261450 RepID=A0A835IRU4_9MAGN|nr:hypothetical protein IFM89_006672 [Coptis chinensis]